MIPSAMEMLRLALRRQAEESKLDTKLVEGVNVYLDYLEDYVNGDATMDESQADTLMSDIVQWHEDSSAKEAGNGFIQVATYINSCRQ